MNDEPILILFLFYVLFQLSTKLINSQDAQRSGWHAWLGNVCRPYARPWMLAIVANRFYSNHSGIDTLQFRFHCPLLDILDDVHHQFFLTNNPGIYI
jgi:hypothetical protein